MSNQNLAAKDVFSLKRGQRVYDTFNNTYGRITSIRETTPDWVSAFITWDGSEQEVEANYVPNVVLVSE